jgi:hypothetical protein
MPIGFEINDYDSDDDISSTEDEIIDLPINDKKNKKLKSKKQKKSILKESKIVKNKAKEKIKSMESEVNDLEFFDYLKEENEKQKAVSFSNDEISGFFTDNELKVQLEELDKLQKYQKHQWKTQDFTHETTQSAIVSNNIKFSMNSMFKKRTNTNSRTKTLSTISRVNTRLPIMKLQKKPKTYRNIGSMW